MNTLLIGLLAETFIHVGGGQSEGVVDLPVAREAVTDYPFIPGSGLKGAMLDWAKQKGLENREDLFGQQDNAGRLLFSDARLLALPVRSLQGASRWITCPHLWERYQRDAARLGHNDIPDLGSKPADGKALGKGGDAVTLEERRFEVSGPVPDEMATAMQKLLALEETRDRLKDTLMVLSDADFAWFARYGLAVQARNRLDEENKTSKNLWYEESLPPDTLLYTLLGERQQGKLDQLLEPLRSTPYLQVGGNETIGQGWLALAFPEAAS